MFLISSTPRLYNFLSSLYCTLTAWFGMCKLCAWNSILSGAVFGTEIDSQTYGHEQERVFDGMIRNWQVEFIGHSPAHVISVQLRVFFFFFVRDLRTKNKIKLAPTVILITTAIVTSYIRFQIDHLHGVLDVGPNLKQRVAQSVVWSDLVSLGHALVPRN